MVVRKTLSVYWRLSLENIWRRDEGVLPMDEKHFY